MNVPLTDMKFNLRGLPRWCQARAPQTMFTLLAFLAAASWISLWLFLFALSWYVLVGVGLSFLAVRDGVIGMRLRRKRWRQDEEVGRLAADRICDLLLKLDAERHASALAQQPAESNEDES